MFDPRSEHERDVERMTRQILESERHQQQGATAGGLFSLNSLFSQPHELADEALHGVAGDIVRAIEPHSEADPAGILVQLLVGVGNMIGRGPHARAESDEHHLNLFAVLVGDSARGRKGTSWGNVRRILGQVDDEWAQSRITSGLSSGEGLIWAVRDPIYGRNPIKEKGRTVDYEEVETDPGVSDKRLLVMEPEYGRALQVAERQANTLSATIRQAWDTGDLRILTKSSSATATAAHISIVGHITETELKRLLTDTQAANGFANRFLWCSVRRSKQLPDGGRFHEVDIEPFVDRIRAALGFARRTGEIRRDDAASEAWRRVYGELTSGGNGLADAVTARADPQVVRLSVLYAVLDCSPVVRLEHLRAALAVWSYCEASARRIFGDSIGDPVADEILAALSMTDDGMTRTDISTLLKRHKSSGRIDSAIELLVSAGVAEAVTIPTDGRPKTNFVATAKKAKNAKKGLEVQ